MSLLHDGQDWWRTWLQQPAFNLYKEDESTIKLSIPVVVDMLMPPLLASYRFDPNTNKWYHFNGHRWALDKGIFDEIRGTIKELLIRAKDSTNKTICVLKDAHKLLNPDFPFKTLKTLENSQNLHKPIQEFDADKLLLNTPNKTYNLLTLEPHPNRAEDFCQFITGIAPLDDENGTKCPQYMQHLRYLTQNNIDDMQFLEDMSGYILTGETFAQEFFWLCGITESGKSQLTIAWREILGGVSESSYYISAPNDLFSQKQNQPHTELWNRIINKRYMLIEEPPGRRLDDNKIKEYFSGNPVSARAMYGSTTGFIPIAKVVFLSNEEPVLNANDEAVIRRMNLYECIQQIPEPKITHFGTKVLFAQEGPYILNRMMLAAQRVLQNQKIYKSPKVIELKKEYVNDNNLIRMFMQDACLTGDDYSETYKNLHSALTIWCATNGYEVPSLAQMRHLLRALRYKRGQTHSARVVLRIALNEEYKAKINKPIYGLYNSEN